MYKLCIIIFFLNTWEIESLKHVKITSPKTPILARYEKQLMKIRIPITIQRRSSLQSEQEDGKTLNDELQSETLLNGNSKENEQTSRRHNTQWSLHENDIEEDNMKSLRRQSSYMDSVRDNALMNYLKRLRKQKSRRDDRNDDEDLRYDIEDESLVFE